MRFFNLVVTIFHELLAFFASMVMLPTGLLRHFHFFGLNPRHLTEPQRHGNPIILLHGVYHNQSGWLPLAWRLWRAGIGPVYTFNYQSPRRRERLLKKIQNIRDQFRAAGREEVALIFVGHSLGAITAAEYAVAPDNHVQGTKVAKLISVAGRLKVTPSPFRFFFEKMVPHIEKVFKKLQEPKVPFDLYTIAADLDYLVPPAACLVTPDATRQFVVKNRSHLSILYAGLAHNQILEWLQKP